MSLLPAEAFPHTRASNAAAYGDLNAACLWQGAVRLNVVDTSAYVRAPENEAPEFARLLRLIEDAAPRRSHISRILVPEFTGRELARIRVSLELSAEEVAYLASVTTWQLRHMEEGHSNPRYRPSSEVFESVRAALHFHIMRRLKRREGVAPERRPKT